MAAYNYKCNKCIHIFNPHRVLNPHKFWCVDCVDFARIADANASHVAQCMCHVISCVCHVGAQIDSTCLRVNNSRLGSSTSRTSSASSTCSMCITCGTSSTNSPSSTSRTSSTSSKALAVLIVLAVPAVLVVLLVLLARVLLVVQY